MSILWTLRLIELSYGKYICILILTNEENVTSIRNEQRAKISKTKSLSTC